MTTVRAGNVDPLRLDRFDLSGLHNGSVTDASATGMTIDQGGGYSLVLDGASLTYDAANHLTGGTVSAITETLLGEIAFSLSSFAIDAGQLDRFAAAGQSAAALSAILAGNDLEVGSGYADTLYGMGGNDVLFGLGGDDTITGGAGEDFVYGGDGADQITGGAGSDTFVGTLSELAGDGYLDFARGDRIVVSDAPYSQATTTMAAAAGGGTSVTVSANGLSTTFGVASSAGTLATAMGPHGELLIVTKPIGAVAADIDGDGRGDYVWQNSNGAISTWTTLGGANGQQVKENSFYATADPSWKVVETFDWNGDGKADVLWRNSGGAMSVWSASGANFQPGTLTRGVSADWRIAATGDFTGDGKHDILWQNKDGAVSEWTSTGTDFVQNSYYHGSPGGNWHVVQQADFDGDGKDDILWRADGGEFAIWRSTGTGYDESYYFDNSVGRDWKIVGTGDVNGDGRADLIWQNGDQLSIWQATSGGFDKYTQSLTVTTAGAQPAPSPFSVVGVEDMNADGRADLLLRAPDGRVATWISDGHEFTPTGYASQAATSWSIADHLFTYG